MGSDDVRRVVERDPVVSSLTVSPEIPESVPFCGQLVDITRYDRREAFDLIDGHISGLYQRVDLVFTDSARYQLLVLTAEIEHKHELVMVIFSHMQSP